MPGGKPKHAPFWYQKIGEKYDGKFPTAATKAAKRKYQRKWIKTPQAKEYMRNYRQTEKYKSCRRKYARGYRARKKNK